MGCSETADKVTSNINGNEQVVELPVGGVLLPAKEHSDTATDAVDTIIGPDTSKSGPITEDEWLSRNSPTPGLVALLKMRLIQ